MINNIDLRALWRGIYMALIIIQGGVTANIDTISDEILRWVIPIGIGAAIAIFAELAGHTAERIDAMRGRRSYYNAR